MSKAEDYIKENIKNNTNISISYNTGEGISSHSQPWLTPDQARKAVEIARKEVIEETVEWLTKHAKKYYFNKEKYLGTDELIEDYELIMSMNNEMQNL